MGGKRETLVEETLEMGRKDLRRLQGQRIGGIWGRRLGGR